MKFFNYVLLLLAFSMFLCRQYLLSHLTHLLSQCTYALLVSTDRILSPWHRWKVRRKTTEELQALLTHTQEEVALLRSENYALRSIEIRGAQFDDLVQWSERYQTKKRSAARILGRVCCDERQQLFLDVGARNGVVHGMIAVFQNILVGRVTEVYPSWCRVTLITDRSSKVPIICASTKIRAIYEGLNMPHYARLTFVSHLHSLHIGDVLLSSGDGLIYPEGFAMGKIKSYELDKWGLHYEVEVEMLIDLTTITHCYLVDKEIAIQSDLHTVDKQMVNVGRIYDAAMS